MFDIGPNLTSVLVALISLGVAAVAAWRAWVAERAAENQKDQVERNSQAIKELKNGGTPKGGES
jgi:L-lactate permease